jgi:predicted glycosyltransferase involved in capsule biosynthesis
MKYSIIISYRDREEHLSKLLPQLRNHFIEGEYEIIVVEQNDIDKFQKNSLYNLAAKRSNGDILIFHDVDYYPVSNISYETDINTPFYPVGRVKFLAEDDTERNFDDIPAGYRNFHNTVGDHSGGVFVLHRDLFEKIGGLNPYYKGWGKEDDDTRERLRLHGYEWKRNKDGLFYALHHEDSKPADGDIDFVNNHIIHYNLKKWLQYGYKDVNADVEEYNADEDLRWLKVSNFIYNEVSI